jgi:hypothetical protein
MSRVSPSARSMASLVISWKTMRRTGTFGSSTSTRCQPMLSPSRSSSVAITSSSACFRAERSLRTTSRFFGETT